jgi:hypothetical protein
MKCDIHTWSYWRGKHKGKNTDRFTPRPTRFPNNFASYCDVPCMCNKRTQLQFICTLDMEICYEFQMAALDLILQNGYTSCALVFLQSWVRVIALEFLSQVDGHKGPAKTGWQTKSRKIYFISTAMNWTGMLRPTQRHKGVTSCVHKQTGFATDESLIYVCSYRTTGRPNDTDHWNRLTLIMCVRI